jgi:hypothetical protein
MRRREDLLCVGCPMGHTETHMPHRRMYITLCRVEDNMVIQ